MGFNNVDVMVSGPKKPSSTYKTKILKGNHSFASQVTEDNTKYVIKHDFDLGGETVTIPKNCVLEFDGGSLNNGKCASNHTIVTGIIRGNALYGAFYNEEDTLLLYNNKTFDYIYGGIDAVYPARMTEDCSPLLDYVAQNIYVTHDYIYLFVCGLNAKTDGACYLYNKKTFLLEGYSQFTVPTHINGLTEKDGYLYFTSDIVTNNRILKISLETLHENCINTYPTTPELVLSNVSTAFISYDYNHKEYVTTDREMHLRVYDSSFNVVKTTQKTLWQMIESYGVDVNYLAVGAIFRNGVLCIIGTSIVSNGVSNYGNYIGQVFIIDVDNEVVLDYREGILGNVNNEVEGVCIDPDDDDIIWISGQIIRANEIQRYNLIGKVSFTKSVNCLSEYYQSGGINARTDLKDINVDNTSPSYGDGGTIPFKYLFSAFFFNTNQGREIKVKGSSANYKIPRPFVLYSNDIVKVTGVENDGVYPKFENFALSTFSNAVIFLSNINIDNKEANVPYTIFVRENSYLKLDNCTFETDTDKPIIYSSDACDVNISNCTFERGNIAISSNGSDLSRVNNNIIKTNTFLSGSNITLNASVTGQTEESNSTTITKVLINGNDVYYAPNGNNDANIVFANISNSSINIITRNSDTIEYLRALLGTHSITEGTILLKLTAFANTKFGPVNNIGLYTNYAPPYPLIAAISDTPAPENDNLGRYQNSLALIKKNSCLLVTAKYNNGGETSRRIPVGGLKNLYNVFEPTDLIRYDGNRYDYPFYGSIRPDDGKLGTMFFDTALGKPIFVKSVSSGMVTAWVDVNGFTATSTKGTTANRPKGIGATGGVLSSSRDLGFCYFDTTINKPIYVSAIANDGTVTWVDATGATV